MIVATSCDGCVDPPEPEPPPAGVSSIVVRPAEVQLGLGNPEALTRVRLRAVVRDAADNIIAPITLVWSSTTAGVTVSGTGADVVVDVPPGTTGTTTITASTGGRSGSASIVITPTTAAAEDNAIVPLTTTADPSVVLASGVKSGGDCISDKLVSVVRQATLGVFPQIPSGSLCRGDVTLFAFDNGVGIAPSLPWTDAADVVDGVAGVGSPSRPLDELPLTLWVDLVDWSSEAALAVGQITTDVQLASSVLQGNRVGLRLSFDPTEVTTFADASLQNCATIPTTGPHAPVDGTINVYYIDRIIGGFYPHGVWCAPSTVLLSWEDRTPTTLVHELGHALSLLEPQQGHTDGIAGFHSDNVMWSYLATTERSHFSIGQAYRMNLEERSWRNSPAGGPLKLPTVRCECDPYASAKCPVLGADIVPVPSGTWSGSCP